MSIEVMRMLQLAAHKDTVARISVKVADDVAHYLQNKKRKEIARLEEAGNIQVQIQGRAGCAAGNAGVRLLRQQQQRGAVPELRERAVAAALVQRQLDDLVYEPEALATDCQL